MKQEEMPVSPITEQDGKLRVPVEYVEWLEKERQRINRADLGKVEFTENGAVVPVPAERIKRFRLVGLNNIDFILTGFYSESQDDNFWKDITEDKPS